MNRKVLLICYYFPPLGLGGVGRPLNLFRRLPEFGWDCHILTVKSVAYRAYEPELLLDLDNSKIFRSGSLDPQRLMYLLGFRTIRGANIERARAASSKFFPDPKVGWVKKAIRLGRLLIENHRYDAIISTAPPISCHQIGKQLAQDFHLPWIADFRDYWTAYRIEQSYSDPHHIDRANALKQEIVEKSSRVIAVNQSVADYLGGGEVIYNAYDEYLAATWQPPPSSGAFTVGVIGHQHDSDSLHIIYRVIHDFATKVAESGGEIRVIHVGQSDRAEVERVLVDENVQIPVEITGRIPREDYIRRLSETSAIMFGIPSVANHDFVPGKLFDLLPSGRPLLIRGNPRGEVAKIVKVWNKNLVFEDPSEGAIRLFTLYRSARNSAPAAVEESAPVEMFSSVHLASRFASILDSLVNNNS